MARTVRGKCPDFQKKSGSLNHGAMERKNVFPTSKEERGGNL